MLNRSESERENLQNPHISRTIKIDIKFLNHDELRERHRDKERERSMKYSNYYFSFLTHSVYLIKDFNEKREATSFEYYLTI
jgi:translation initiation factor 2 beta subunit (eIF-2beta)/eIF-5